MSPIYLGGTKLNTVYFGGTKINKAYVGSTLVYSSEFIGAVSIAISITYLDIVITDTNCIPAGAEVTMVASFSGTATDAVFAWSKPAGSSAPVDGVTTSSIAWTAAAGDGGAYGVTVTSRNSSDTPQTAQESVNIFAYIAPGFADADADYWITRVELLDCGQLETGVRNAMNQLVLDLKTSGYYAASAVIHPMIGPRNGRALTPLKAPRLNVFDTSNYNRQLGVRKTPANYQSILEYQYDFSIAVAAGQQVGTACYVTSFYNTSNNPNTLPWAYFFRHAAPGSSINSGATNDEFSVYGIFDLYAAKLIGGVGSTQYPAIPNWTAGNVPVFVAATRGAGTGFIGTKLRVNDNYIEQGSTQPLPGPSVLGLPAELMNLTQRSDYAFMISGAGLDYTAPALRTIIETYVAAIQAAVPG